MWAMDVSLRNPALTIVDAAILDGRNSADRHWRMGRRDQLGTSREPQVKYLKESHGTEIPTDFDEARA